MKIMIAPDSFKGSLSALEVCNHIENGIKKVLPQSECLYFPMADGGEGTVDSILMHNAGELKYVDVLGPNKEVVKASLAVLDSNIVVLEMASASGLPLCKHFDVLHATSYGTGQLIKKALDYDCKKVYIGLGGSATNDGGVGMAQALGVSFLDKKGNEISYGAMDLNKIHSISMDAVDQRLKDVEIIALCDVVNPLYGSNGATAVYGKQKGASSKDQELLEKGLIHYAAMCSQFFKTSFQNDVGVGAAGGVGFALKTFFKAKIVSGIKTVISLTHFEKTLFEYDLIISGEGCLDEQSLNGKVIGGLVEVALAHKKPIVAIVGSAKQGAYHLLNKGLDAFESCVTYPCSLEKAIETAADNVEKAAQRLMRAMQIKCER